MTVPARTKIEVVEELARRLGAPTPRMSTGSTEPREIFDLINDRLGLGIDRSRTKQATAKGIVEAAGFPWLPTYDSRGGTVTLEGLEAVVRAVKFFLP